MITRLTFRRHYPKSIPTRYRSRLFLSTLALPLKLMHYVNFGL